MAPILIHQTQSIHKPILIQQTQSIEWISPHFPSASPGNPGRALNSTIRQVNREKCRIWRDRTLDLYRDTPQRLGLAAADIESPEGPEVSGEKLKVFQTETLWD
jgi:hypothetical protein